MAFTGNFEVLQGYNPANFTINDISVGSDGGITARHIHFIKADGSFLTPEGSELDYILWPLADTSIDITNLLLRDYALAIKVNWIIAMEVEGNVYEVTKVYVFKGYGEQFDYSLTQKMAANPAIVKDTTFMSNKGKLRTYLDNAFNAVASASDQTNAQFNLDQSYYLQLNESSLF